MYHPVVTMFRANRQLIYGSLPLPRLDCDSRFAICFDHGATCSPCQYRCPEGGVFLTYLSSECNLIALVLLASELLPHQPSRVRASLSSYSTRPQRKLTDVATPSPANSIIPLLERSPNASPINSPEMQLIDTLAHTTYRFQCWIPSLYRKPFEQRAAMHCGTETNT